MSYIISRLDEEAQVSSSTKNSKIIVTVKTKNTGKIIGKGGYVINSIEYLATKHARKLFGEKTRIVLQIDSDKKSAPPTAPEAATAQTAVTPAVSDTPSE